MKSPEINLLGSSIICEIDRRDINFSSDDTEKKIVIVDSSSRRAGQRRLKTETFSQSNIHDLYVNNALAVHGNEELIQILIKYGNNPDGIPALLYAIKLNDENAVQILLENGASPYTKDHLHRNCLYFAVKSGNLNLIDKFIALGVDLDEIADDGHVPLTLAIKERRNDIAKHLFMRGAASYIENPNYQPVNAFEHCSIYGNFEFLSFLIEKEAKFVDYPITNGFDGIAYILLNKTEDFNKEIQNGRFKCLHFLLNKKLLKLPSDPNSYFHVISGIYPEAFEYLLDNEYLSPNHSFGNHTLLQLAAMNDLFQIELVEMLIKRGVNVQAKSLYDRTVLHAVAPSSTLDASQFETYKRLFQILVNAGIDLNTKDSFGRTVLAMTKDENLKNWLITQGAK
jgi:ankyrin repeat protein